MEIVLGIAVGLALVYVFTLTALLIYGIRNPDAISFKDALRFLPDLLLLVGRLVRDKSLPLRVRLAVGALMLYLLCPIDFVPDFLPVIGYADDAIVIALVLRFVVRSSGVEAIDRHWTGSSSGGNLIRRLTLKG